MAKLTSLPTSSIIVGASQSGKSTWALQLFFALQGYAIYIDYNRAYLRLYPGGDMSCYYKGSFGIVKRAMAYCLLKRHKVIYCPPDQQAIEDMFQWLFSLKNANMREFTPIYIFADEVDMYSDRDSSVEHCWTKYQGAALYGIGISQRPSMLQNLSILFNSNDFILFNIGDGEAMRIRGNYAIDFSDEDLAYIQQNKYSALHISRSTKVVERL